MEAFESTPHRMVPDSYRKQLRQSRRELLVLIRTRLESSSSIELSVRPAGRGLTLSGAMVARSCPSTHMSCAPRSSWVAVDPS